MQAEYRAHFRLAPAEIHVGPFLAQDPADAYQVALQSLDPVLADLAREVPRSHVVIERLEEGGSL